MLAIFGMFFAIFSPLIGNKTFTENPEKGAAEQLSRTPSRASLNPIAEDLAKERWTDSNNTRQERNEVCEYQSNLVLYSSWILKL